MGSAGTGLTGTTHVSVIDEEGNAAALSSTLGSGSGEFSGGFQLNNMLGELDVIGIDERAAGERLPSMMAPTLVLADGEPRLVVGSAGSVRLSGAILQVIHHVVAGGRLGRPSPSTIHGCTSRMMSSRSKAAGRRDGEALAGGGSRA